MEITFSAHATTQEAIYNFGLGTDYFTTEDFKKRHGDISVSAFYQGCNELVKKGLMTRLARGVYTIAKTSEKPSEKPTTVPTEIPADHFSSVQIGKGVIDLIESLKGTIKTLEEENLELLADLMECQKERDELQQVYNKAKLEAGSIPVKEIFRPGGVI